MDLNINPSSNYSDLVFEDNFDDIVIDSEGWYCAEQGLNYNNEDQAYICDQVSVRNGLLVLSAEKENWSGDSGRADRPGVVFQSYVSGELNSIKSWKYGKFEIRAKIPPQTQGILSAIWLTPSDKLLWPPEIDVMEVLGHDPSTVYFTSHYGTQSNHKRHSGKKENLSLSDDFHIYSITWNETSITWLIDDEEYYKVTEDIPHIPMILRISLPVGPDWEGDPVDPSVFPQSFIIDWVKIYQ